MSHRDRGVESSEADRFPVRIDPFLDPRYRFRAYIFDVYDGDTVYYHADLGCNQWAAFQTGRLLDIDAPELRPLRSRVAGEASRAQLWRLIRRYALNRHEPPSPLGHLICVETTPAENRWFSDVARDRRGKYGRWLVTLYGADRNGDAINLNQLMVTFGYARRYGEAG